MSFNGGRSQVNLNFGQIGGDYPFINQILNFGTFSLADNSGSPSPSDLDSNGYPLNGSNAINVHGGIFCLGYIPAAFNAGTIYAVQVTGKGSLFGFGTLLQATVTGVTSGTTTQITVGLNHYFTDGMQTVFAGITGSGTMAAVLNGNIFTVLSHTSTTITVNANTTGVWSSGGTQQASYGAFTVGVATGGRIVVDISGQPAVGNSIKVSAYITATDAVSPITKVAMVRVGSEETRYNSGEIFGIDFLNKLASANFGVIRFLNSMNTNISNVVNWADRTPQGYLNYVMSNLKSSIYAGTAVGTGNDYTGTLGLGALVDKQQVITAFPAASVTVSSGANAVISYTGHPFVAGDVFNLFGDHSSVEPGGMIFDTGGVTTNYYVSATGLTANSFQFSTTQGGASVTTSSTGSGSLYVHKTVVDSPVTFTNGSTSIVWTGHQLSVNDPVSFSDGPTNYNINGGIYYVKTVPDANHITVALTAGGTAITAASAGTGTGVRCPTYNLDGLGVKPILSASAQNISVAGNTIPRARYFGTSIVFATLTYDALLGCWLLYGAQDGFGTQGISAYWPPEVCFALCNHPLIQAHPWFTSPPLVLDGSAGITDFMPSLATYVKGVQPGWMVPRYEIHNELWNTAFPGTTIGKAHASAYKAAGTWTVDGFDEYAGKVGSVLGQAINNVYAGSVGSGYQMISGVWTGVMDSTVDANARDPRLTSAQYVGQSASPQSPYTKTAASNWVTNICCTQYITPADYGTGTETTLAAAFNGVRFTASVSGTTLAVSSTEFGSLASGMTIFGTGITTPVTISGTAPNWTLSSGANGTLASRALFAGADMTAPQTYVDSLGGAASGFNINTLASLYGFINAWGRKFTNNAGNLIKMCGYEGGYSPDYFGSPQANMLRFAGKFVASSPGNATGLQGYTKTNYDNFLSNTGAEFPSCFQFSGQDPTSDTWSVLEDIYQTPLPPQWLAIVAFNAVAATSTTFSGPGFSVVHGRGGRNHKMIGY